MVYLEAESQMQRSSSMPMPVGRSRRSSLLEAVLQQQRFEEMRNYADAMEKEAMEENYDALDALVRLDFNASQLRRGKTFDSSIPFVLTCPRKERLRSAIGTFEATTTRSSDFGLTSGHVSGQKQRSKQPACTRSTSLPKLPKIASSTPSSSVKGATSSSTRASSKARRKSSKEAPAIRQCGADYEAAQLEAFRTLVASLDADKPLDDLLNSITKHVLTHLGTKAFTAEQRRSAVETALTQLCLLEEPALSDAADERVELVVMSLRIMCQESGTDFCDVVGQALWRNRRSEALQKKQHKETAEDLRWLVPSGTSGNDKQAEQLQIVDDVFNSLCGENGRMNSKGWQQIVRLVSQSPVLASRVHLSDVDRLWYTQVRSSSSKDFQRDISLHDFKSLLLSLGESMKVHPWMVFLAVGSHGYSRLSSSRRLSVTSTSSTDEKFSRRSVSSTSSQQSLLSQARSTGSVSTMASQQSLLSTNSSICSSSPSRCSTPGRLRSKA